MPNRFKRLPFTGALFTKKGRCYINEQQIETLGKLFPNGFICIGIMPNRKVHIAYLNPEHLQVMSELEEIINDAVQAELDEQESEDSNGDNESTCDSCGEHLDK